MERKKRHTVEEANKTKRGQAGQKTAYPGLIRLNKFIASSGLCSRRDADELIRQGEIKVNGKVITDLGVKVKHDDIVRFRGKRLVTEKKVYILMNKPKDCVTTVEDSHAEKTVIDLLGDKCTNRVYP